MSLNKIRILGGPGGGKSYASIKLSEILKIPCYSLDDIKWNNNSKKYNTKNTPRVRDKKLNDVLKKDKWILEGGYNDWDFNAYKKANIIIVIKPNPLIRDFRIILRYLKNKIGIETGKRENIANVIGLIKWNHEFEKEYGSKIEKIIENFHRKVKIAKSGQSAVDSVV